MKTEKEIQHKINELSDWGLYLMQTRSWFDNNKKQLEKCDAEIKILQWVLR